MSRDLESLARRLTTIARDRAQGLGHDIEWPDRVPEAAWYMSPELISLYGTTFWDQLDDRQRRRLSFLETVNFFSLNIHGERALLEGMVRRLYRGCSPTVSRYLQHFIDEENRHLYYFSRFCLDYAGSIYPDRKVVFPSDHTDESEDLRYFAKVLVFEEIVDVYNVTMAKDERLEPVARRINDMHHRDETHHLAFGRAIVCDLADELDPAARAEVRDYLGEYIRTVWREYYNPTVYAELPIPDPYQVAAAAFDSTARQEQRRQVSARLHRSLSEAGLLSEECRL